MSDYISKKQINNLIVKAAPKIGDDNEKPFRCPELFVDGYGNIFLSAKKKSGKTSNLFFILKKILGKDTKLIVFCSKVHKDDTWRFMIPFFKEKGIDVEVHTSIKDGKVDLIDKWVKEQEVLVEDGDEEEEEPDPKEIVKQKGLGAMNAILRHNLPKVIDGNGKPKKKVSKYKERKFVMVLDDLSTELKAVSLVGLLKSSRHLKMTVLISTQYYLDMVPSARQQIDVFLLYKGQTEEKLEAIYKDADLSIDYNVFQHLYEDATKEKHNFLYIAAREDEFRHNYNMKYDI